MTDSSPAELLPSHEAAVPREIRELLQDDFGECERFVDLVTGRQGVRLLLTD